MPLRLLEQSGAGVRVYVLRTVFMDFARCFLFFFSLTNSFLINCENRQKNAKSSAFHLFDVLSLGIVIRSTPNTYVVCKYELPVS